MHRGLMVSAVVHAAVLALALFLTTDLRPPCLTSLQRIRCHHAWCGCPCPAQLVEAEGAAIA
jgi:hypothetical protein